MTNNKSYQTSQWLPLRFAFNEVRHGWRHFAIFLSCLVLGVSIMAAVNTLGDLVKISLANEAKSLLGGDLEVEIRGVEANAEQVSFLEGYGQVSKVSSLRSMMIVNDQNTLIEIKAVDESYPLVGTLVFEKILDTLAVENTQTDQAKALNAAIFASKGIAVDPILLTQLNLSLGDQVQIGDASFEIRATIAREPDRALQIFTFGPRVMMNQASLKASGLVSTFSLVEHEYRILSPSQMLQDGQLEAEVESALQENFPEISWRVRSGNDGNQSLQRFINQFIAFMNLSGLATFIIAGIGIASSTRSYLEKKLPSIAVLKVQGASSGFILKTYLLVLGILVSLGGFIGVVIAAAITMTLVPVLANFIPTLLNQTGFYWQAFLLAFWYGVLVSYLFSMPALLSAMNVKPAVLFRRTQGVLLFERAWLPLLVVACILTLLFITLFLSANDKAVMMGAILVALVAMAFFGLCNRCIQLIAQNIKVEKPWLRLVLRYLHRPGSTSGTVILAIGVSLTVLIALSLTEANFKVRLNEIVERRAPHLFLVDIQPHQKQEIQNLLSSTTPQENITMSPMVRGRITHLNGVAVESVAVDEDIQWAVRGDRGISYTKTPPENANIVQGEFWPEDYQGEPLLSVDERFLDGMGLQLGDTMTVSILGQSITGKITSARRIDYSTFQLNFAMLFSPGVLEDFPHTSLATAYLENPAEDEAELIQTIAKNYPGITTIRTREVIAMVRSIMEHIATALRFTVALSLIAGLLVLSAALNASIRQRVYDIAVLKVLGSRRADILKSCCVEWAFLGGITACLATVIGGGAAYLLNARFRGETFYFVPEVVLTIICACILVVLAIGYFGSRKIFELKPARLLRNE